MRQMRGTRLVIIGFGGLKRYCKTMLTLCASTGRRLLIWMLLTALRVTATISGRIRSMPLATIVRAWKVSSSRQSSNDVKIRKTAREPSHEDSRAAWSCLLWSRGVRVIPTSRCDFALTVWRACAVRRYCAQQKSVSFVQRTISFTSRGIQNPSGERSVRRLNGEHKLGIALAITINIAAE